MKPIQFWSFFLLLFSPLLSFSQTSKPVGNDLFSLLNKPVSSQIVKSFDDAYRIETKDNSIHWQRSNGIEYFIKKDSIKKITLHYYDDEWSTYSDALPLYLKWGMSEEEITKLLGEREQGLPYHYDLNLDLVPRYNDDKKLSAIELKYTDYKMQNAAEMDDDALLALFLSDPGKFKYLKPGVTKNQTVQKQNVPDAATSFDKNLFKKQLNKIIAFYVDKKPDELKGNFIKEVKGEVITYKYYSSTTPVSNVKDQYLEKKNEWEKISYVIILDEMTSSKATNFPTAVMSKYNEWLGILKEMFTQPWISEEAEVYDGILDKGTTFENKTGQTTSGGFTYYKYPFIDLYIVYKKDHYSIELKVY